MHVHSILAKTNIKDADRELRYCIYCVYENYKIVFMHGVKLSRTSRTLKHWDDREGWRCQVVKSLDFREEEQEFMVVDFCNDFFRS